MAYEMPGFSFTLVTGVDFSSSEFFFCDVNSSGLAVLPTGSGAHVIGVVNNKPKLGESATIFRSGISQVVAGAAINPGQQVMTNASGQAIPFVATGTYTPPLALIVGTALETASASGVIIAVALNPI